MSPNGNGLCVYEYGNRACGQGDVSSVHTRIPLSDFGGQLDPVAQYVATRLKADGSYETYHGAVFPVDNPPTTTQIVAMFHDTALRLVVAKNQAYGSAWKKQGYIGNVARVLSKVERLRNLVWCDDQDQILTDAHEETLRDTLLDLANLCAFTAHNLAEGNRWGR